MAQDQRITDNQNKWDDEIKEVTDTYDGLVSDAENKYNDALDGLADWQVKQEQVLTDNTNHTIDTIEQKQEQEYNDYLKEQTAAYTDYEKAVDPYGVNAEKMASMGMTNTGYSESSKVRMYNQYQNRVAIARAAYKQANIEFENMMTQAKLQNDSALAQLGFEIYQRKLELTLEGFQYKNNLILDLAKTKREINSRYQQNYLQILDMINSENSKNSGIIDKTTGDESTLDGTTVYGPVAPPNLASVEELNEIRSTFGQYGTVAELEKVLSDLVANNKLTEDQAGDLYEEYKRKYPSGVKLYNSISPSIKYPNDPVLRLVDEGMTLEQANAFVKDVQEKLGFK